MSYIRFNCDNCGDLSKQKESQYKRKKRHFCSMECYAEFKRTKLPIQEHPRWEGGISPQEARRRYYQKNKKKIEAMRRERQLREIMADGGHTNEEWQAKLKAYNYKCAIDDDTCSGKITKDHEVPLIMGGSNDIDNIVPLCGSHNSRKWKKVAVDL